MSEIKNLSPEPVWRYFDEITRIPRPSKHEERIIASLIAFAEEQNLEYQRDATGNIVIRRSASPGMEGAPGVILQSHVDMVAEKNSGVTFDFLQDPIETYIDGGWVRARGTTLGADDGIGVAAALTVLAGEIPVHGPVEALFTVDEESGLTGATGLAAGMLRGKYLINLDSEDEGRLFIGCAGGIGTTAIFSYEEEPVPADSKAFTVAVSGLAGGHSGEDIDRGHANSNKVLVRFLLRAAERFDARLSTFDGGNLHNAIPREASAVFTVPSEFEAEMRRAFDAYALEIREEYKHTEPHAAFSLTPADAKTVIDRPTQRGLLLAVEGAANGPLAMSRAMPGLVETSTNLASIKFTENRQIVVVTSQRSSVESAKEEAARTVAAPFRLAGAQVVHSDGYPGWTPDPDSHLLQVAAGVYREKFSREPEIRAIHAGLECGLFLEKYPALEMISIGPTLRGVHSPDERLEIATVGMFWELLEGILGKLNG